MPFFSKDEERDRKSTWFRLSSRNLVKPCISFLLLLEWVTRDSEPVNYLASLSPALFNSNQSLGIQLDGELNYGTTGVQLNVDKRQVCFETGNRKSTESGEKSWPRCNSLANTLSCLDSLQLEDCGSNFPWLPVFRVMRRHFILSL